MPLHLALIVVLLFVAGACSPSWSEPEEDAGPTADSQTTRRDGGTDASAHTNGPARGDSGAQTGNPSKADTGAQAGSQWTDPGPATPGGAAVPTQGRFATVSEARAAGELVLHDDGFETAETLCAGDLCVKGGLEP
jgi:hypothetical protein